MCAVSCSAIDCCKEPGSDLQFNLIWKIGNIYSKVCKSTGTNCNITDALAQFLWSKHALNVRETRMETVCLVWLCVLSINQFDYIEKSFYWSVEYGSLLLFIKCPKMELQLRKCYFCLLHSYRSLSPVVVLVCFCCCSFVIVFCFESSLFQSP